MEYLNTTLCLEFDELVPSIMVKSTYDQLKFRDNITVHGRGGNGQKVLVEFESMPPRYKGIVRETYGDPYVYAAKAPLLNALVWDHAAQRFYREYILPTGDRLPDTDTDLNGKTQINYVQRYTEAATWLNMLTRMTTDKAALKRELNLSIMTFWEQATDLIKIKMVNLPANPKRLKEKLKTYQAEGYGSLVETHKFGNDYSRKIKDEEAEALLKGFLSHRNKFDDTVIAEKYNAWAMETKRETITPGAVGYWRKKWRSMLMLERDGVAKLYTSLSKQGQRKRPSAPLLLINSDDNVLDAFFRTADNKWFRPVLYVVMDAHNDYILGYAAGATVTKELVKEAYRNAQRHVMNITGGAHMWDQIQTDHWGISGKNTTELEHFYNSMAKFTPAGLKNSQTKYVERSFGVTWHQQLKENFLQNYSGHNVKAKENLNPDSLVPANFPTIEEGVQMIDAFIWSLRNTKRKGCDLTRHDEWVQNFEASDKAKARLLTTEERLSIFGKVHEYTNQITTKGVTPTINGQKLVYELSQDQIFQHIGKSVQVVYDEYDLSEVLITDGQKLRFTAQQYELLPSAIADYAEGDKDRINALLTEKKTMLPKILAWGNDWKTTLEQGGVSAEKLLQERGGIDTESRLKAGVLTKEINHDDQRNYFKKALNSPQKAISKPLSTDDDDIYNLM